MLYVFTVHASDESLSQPQSHAACTYVCTQTIGMDIAKKLFQLNAVVRKHVVSFWWCETMSPFCKFGMR